MRKCCQRLLGRGSVRKITESLKEKSVLLCEVVVDGNGDWGCNCDCDCNWGGGEWTVDVKLVLVAPHAAPSQRRHKLGHLLLQVERSIGWNQRCGQRWQQQKLQQSRGSSSSNTNTHITHTHTHKGAFQTSHAALQGGGGGARRGNLNCLNGPWSWYAAAA